MTADTSPAAELDGKASGVPAVGTGPSAVRLVHVDAGYGDRIALEDMNLEIPVGALVAIVGPNGGGKSTLLKLIAGVLKPWTGSVDVLGAAAGLARTLVNQPCGAARRSRAPPAAAARAPARSRRARRR